MDTFHAPSTTVTESKGKIRDTLILIKTLVESLS